MNVNIINLSINLIKNKGKWYDDIHYIEIIKLALKIGIKIT